ncbi:MAG: hypothetical protein P0S96_05335 [Simkaniaceae bacterium]|nr:hypothetical protein [Candidatus Sacchlamyda saccharinae]
MPNQEEDIHDTKLLGKALRRINDQKGVVLFDAIAEGKNCYEINQRHNKKLITPPSKRAILRKEPIYKDQNEALRIFKGLILPDLFGANLVDIAKGAPYRV